MGKNRNSIWARTFGRWSAALGAYAVWLWLALGVLAVYFLWPLLDGVGGGLTNLYDATIGRLLRIIKHPSYRHFGLTDLNNITADARAIMNALGTDGAMGMRMFTEDEAAAWNSLRKYSINFYAGNMTHGGVRPVQWLEVLTMEYERLTKEATGLGRSLAADCMSYMGGYPLDKIWG